MREISAVPSQNVSPSVLLDRLWHRTDEDVDAWALIDGQWADGVVEILEESGLEYCCLFEGALTSERLYESPYLIRMRRDSALSEHLFSQGWGKGWGFYFQASAEHVASELPNVSKAHVARLRAAGQFYGSPELENSEDTTILRLRKHFRRFTRVHLEEDGRVVTFRFFDPAILRTYLETGLTGAARTFLGPLRYVLMEDFSAVRNLNNPKEALIFALRESSAEQSDRYTSLEIHRLDVETGSFNDYSEVRLSGDRIMNDSIGLTEIRKEQSESFRGRQRSSFEGEIVEMILKRRATDDTADLDEARLLVRGSVATGRGLGLRSRGDLANFSLCAELFGKDFATREPSAARIFGKEDASKSAAISASLARWAKTGSMDR